VTTQAEDVVRFGGEEWTLYAETAELFDVSALGLGFTFVSTASWRGHQLVYEIGEDRLFIEELRAGLDPIPGSVLGAPPTLQTNGDMFPVVFRSLKHPIQFTGSILIVADMLKWPLIRSELYEFGRVFEISFEVGEVKETVDRSDEVAVLRKQMAHAEEHFVPQPALRKQSWEFDQLVFDLANACEGTFYWKYFSPRLMRYRRMRAWADAKE
jgi:hypothetical protein